jgi:hypothetical protein
MVATWMKTLHGIMVKLGNVGWEFQAYLFLVRDDGNS